MPAEHDQRHHRCPSSFCWALPLKYSISPLLLTEERRVKLKELAGSRTLPIREVERAQILLGYAEGASITDLMRRVGVGRPMIYKGIDKALAAGIGTGLKDSYHRPHEPEITDEAKAWVVSIACTKPTDHDLAAELWSISALARFVSQQGPKPPGIRVCDKPARVPSGEF